MARENPYFLLSGFLSLFFFFLIDTLFFYMMFSKTSVNTYALKEDTFISISLETVSIPTKTRKKEAVVVKEEPKVTQKAKEVDIGNLFSDVWTKDITIKKKETQKIDTKILRKIQKKLNMSEKNSVKPIIENINNMQANVVDIQSVKSSSADEVNEYLARIQAIVYRYFKPPANSQGYTVKAMIELSAIGKVIDFRILTYSSNVALNQECDQIRSRLLTVLFPTNPDAQTSKTIVNITSDKN